MIQISFLSKFYFMYAWLVQANHPIILPVIISEE